jgi:hypothetical protein
MKHMYVKFPVQFSVSLRVFDINTQNSRTTKNPVISQDSFTEMIFG